MLDRTRLALSDPSRRAVLRGAGLVALAGGGGALAACSADEGGTAAPSATAPSSSAAASTPAPPAPASSSAAVPDGPAVATAEVPVGSGVILPDADYVITQPSEGNFKAFRKICTHKGCPVAEVSGQEIVCNCHGSRFSIADGSVTKPPADDPLPEAEVTVVGDRVVVTG